MKTIPMTFGVEFECIVTQETLDFWRDKDIHIGSYHEQKYNRYGFRVETDGSVHPVSNQAGMGVEIISKPFVKEDVTKIVTRLKRMTGDKEKMLDALSFNSTTGAHIHTKIFDQQASSFIGFKTALIFKDMLFQKVKEYLGASRGEKWCADFVRERFAGNVDDWTNDKYRWIRLHPGCKTVEIRGMHLRGMKTWEEVIDMINIAIQCWTDAVIVGFEKHVVTDSRLVSNVTKHKERSSGRSVCIKERRDVMNRLNYVDHKSMHHLTRTNKRITIRGRVATPSSYSSASMTYAEMKALQSRFDGLPESTKEALFNAAKAEQWSVFRKIVAQANAFTAEENTYV